MCGQCHPVLIRTWRGLRGFAETLHRSLGSLLPLGSRQVSLVASGQDFGPSITSLASSSLTKVVSTVAEDVGGFLSLV